MGSVTSIECCTTRERLDDEQQPWQIDRHHSWQSVPEAEEYLQFLDCEEWPDTPGKHAKFVRKGTFELVHSINEAEEAGSDSLRKSASYVARTQAQGEEDARHENKVPMVIERVREAWKRIQDEGLEKNGSDRIGGELIRDGPELNDWTEDGVVRRMLRAAEGNVDQAVQTLMKAIECRVRDRQLYRKLRCQVVCDARVIGRDKDQRPVVYTCAHSQTAPLKDMLPQVCLAMEAAVLLSRHDGYVDLVVDMYKFKTSPNMDVTALKRLAETFSSVFAERFNLIIVVDFSIVAQGIWSIVKGSLSEKTRRKMHFVNEAKAREIIQERFAPATIDRILASFDINRDALSKPEEREEHARKTSICNVPISHEQHSLDSVGA